MILQRQRNYQLRDVCWALFILLEQEMVYFDSYGLLIFSWAYIKDTASNILTAWPVTSHFFVDTIFLSSWRHGFLSLEVAILLNVEIDRCNMYVTHDQQKTYEISGGQYCLIKLKSNFEPRWGSVVKNFKWKHVWLDDSPLKECVGDPYLAGSNC